MSVMAVNYNAPSKSSGLGLLTDGAGEIKAGLTKG